MWGGTWGRLFFPGFWLVYLGSTISYVAGHQHGWRAVAGYVIVGVFAVVYMVALPMGWGGRARMFWPLYALAVALTIGEGFFARQQSMAFCVYLAVLTIASRTRYGRYLVTALILASALLPRVLPGWGGQVDWNGGLTVGLVSIAMYG